MAILGKVKFNYLYVNKSYACCILNCIFFVLYKNRKLWTIMITVWNAALREMETTLFYSKNNFISPIIFYTPKTCLRQKYYSTPNYFSTPQVFFIHQKYFFCGKNIFLHQKHFSTPKIFFYAKNIFLHQKYLSMPKIYLYTKNGCCPKQLTFFRCAVKQMTISFFLWFFEVT